MIMFLLSVVCIALIVAIGGLIFALFLLGLGRLTIRKAPCKVKFDGGNKDAIVGESVVFRVFLNKSESLLATSDFSKDVSISIRPGLSYHAIQATKIEYLSEYDGSEKAVVIKFAVRQSGLYIIDVSYKGVRASGAPFRKRFRPSFIEASKTIFLRPCPTILCVMGDQISHQIQPRDKFGNDCDPETMWQGTNTEAEASLEERLKFLVEFADEPSSALEVGGETLSALFVTRKGAGSRVEVITSVHVPGVYKASILFDEEPILNGQFSLLCIQRPEYRKMVEISQSNPAWTSHAATLIAIGKEVQKKAKQVYLYCSPKLLYVQEFRLKIIPFKVATYRVSPMTKIKMIYRDSEISSSDYIFAISDGIQPTVTVRMEGGKARVLLALFFTSLQKRLGGSENFEGKQRVFYRELNETMKDLRLTSKEVKISRPNLVYSSMQETKYWRKGDWCKNFGIKFENEMGYDHGGLRREWLELLSVQFFQDCKFGMFSSMGNSRLVHPNPSSQRLPLWTLKHYEFAGKIVGKCLFESSCGSTYTQMVKGKFSRSFLAQVLGLPPNCQHFEQDDPELFVSKVKYILENDVEHMDLTFTEEEYDEKGKLLKTVELIPNGGKVKVTMDNREQYLNALALYRLGSKVSKEIDSFKRGLHDLVPEELLTNFDENELELLLCGRSEFDIDDLKAHLVKDWSFGVTASKIFSWFCTSVSNMSDEERARLLQFTTGSSLLPHGGFKALNPPFRVSISGEFGKLPRAHTCFNTICLSDHESFESFERSLKIAVTEGAEGFAFT